MWDFSECVIVICDKIDGTPSLFSSSGGSKARYKKKTHSSHESSHHIEGFGTSSSVCGLQQIVKCVLRDALLSSRDHVEVRLFFFTFQTICNLLRAEVQ